MLRLSLQTWCQNATKALRGLETGSFSERLQYVISGIVETVRNFGKRTFKISNTIVKSVASKEIMLFGFR